MSEEIQQKGGILIFRYTHCIVGWRKEGGKVKFVDKKKLNLENTQSVDTRIGT
jgi:hypothetical protein